MFTNFSEFNEYFDNLQRSSSPHTIRSYRKSIIDFLEYCYVASLDDLKKINAKQIGIYSDFLSERMISSSINTNLRPISAFFHWLKEKEYIDNLIVDKLKFRKEPKKLPVIPTDDEINQIINAEDDKQNKLMILLMATTGIRREEVTDIKIEDIQDDEIIIHGKGDKERKVFLHPKVQELLKIYLRRNKNEYLFVSHRGKHQISTQTVQDRLKDGQLKQELIQKELKKSLRTNLDILPQVIG